MFKRCCADCGTSFEAKRRSAEFCSTACRKTFNNRRAVRGAELYDLVMMTRFDRKAAADEKIWGTICALASAYRDSDKILRDGRESWDNQALQRVPQAFGKHGDKR